MDNRLRELISQIFHIIIDIFCVTLVGLPPILLKKYGTPYKRGFFCDDEDLKHPNLPSTISWNMTVAVGCLLPIVTIFVFEAVKYYISYRSHQISESYQIGKLSINNWLWTWYKEAGIFAFGLAFSQSVNDIGKYAIGRLRPHFLEVCKPDWAALAQNCTNSVYITDDVCTGNPHSVREARLSFPSGHASYVWYCLLYLAIYIEVKMNWKGSTLLKHVLSGAAITAAYVVSLSRVSDYKHHPSDVIAGALIGIIGCLLVVRCISNFGSKTSSAEKRPLLSDQQDLVARTQV